MAGLFRGTLCSLRCFVWCAGITQTAFVRSISSQVAWVASPARTAVLMMYSRQYWATMFVVCSRIVEIVSRICVYGTDTR